MWPAVTVQAHQPTGWETAISRPSSSGVSQRASSS
jgi:hypothetical protein